MFGYTIIKSTELEKLRNEYKELVASRHELENRWISGCYKEDVISRILGLPPEVMIKCRSRIVVAIKEEIHKEQNCSKCWREAARKHIQEEQTDGE